MGKFFANVGSSLIINVIIIATLSPLSFFLSSPPLMCFSAFPSLHHVSIPSGLSGLWWTVRRTSAIYSSVFLGSVVCGDMGTHHLRDTSISL